MRVHGTHTFESTPPEGLYPSIPVPQPTREHLRPGKTPCDRVSEHPKELPSVGSAEASSHRTDEAGLAETPGLGKFADAYAQAEISLPMRVEAVWQCHCIGADTVVDAPCQEERDLFEEEVGSSVVESAQSDSGSSDAALRAVRTAQKEIQAAASLASEAAESVQGDPRKQNEPNMNCEMKSQGPLIAEIDSLESVSMPDGGEEVAEEDFPPVVGHGAKQMQDRGESESSKDDHTPTRVGSFRDVSDSPGIFDFDELDNSAEIIIDFDELEKSPEDENDDDAESDVGEVPNLSDSEDEEPVPMWKHLGRPEPIERSWDDIVQSMIG